MSDWFAQAVQNLPPEQQVQRLLAAIDVLSRQAPFEHRPQRLALAERAIESLEAARHGRMSRREADQHVGEWRAEVDRWVPESGAPAA